jgi:hypothetical protein
LTIPNLRAGDVITIDGLDDVDIFFRNDLFQVTVPDDGSLILPCKVAVISRPVLGSHDTRWLTKTQMQHIRLAVPRARKPFAKRTA